MESKLDNNYPIINQTNTYVLPNTQTQTMLQVETPNTVFDAMQKNNSQDASDPIKINFAGGGLNIGNDQTNVKFIFGLKGLEDITNIKVENIKVTFDSVEIRQKINSDMTVSLGYKREDNNIETYSVGFKWVF